jgi:hypothetical protein
MEMKPSPINRGRSEKSADFSVFYNKANATPGITFAKIAITIP